MIIEWKNVFLIVFWYIIILNNKIDFNFNVKDFLNVYFILMMF